MISTKWLLLGLVGFFFGWIWYTKKKQPETSTTATPPQPINVYVEVPPTPQQPVPTVIQAPPVAPVYVPPEPAYVPPPPIVDVFTPPSTGQGSSLTMAGYSRGDSSTKAIDSLGPDSIAKLGAYSYNYGGGSEPGGSPRAASIYQQYEAMRDRGDDTTEIRSQILTALGVG